MTYVGIDVSKATFVVAYSSAKGSRTNSFKNTVKGIHEFIQTISVAEHHCVLEATGNYSALLVYLLSEAGIAVSLENPLKIKNFARVMLSVTKTDEIDARLIAMYGEKMQPTSYKLRNDTILILKQKRTVIRQLKKQLVATGNLKGSMEVLPFFDPKCKKTIEKTIIFLEKQIKGLEEELASLAQSEYKKQMDLLTSIKGIGVTLAAALIMATSPTLIMPSNSPDTWDCHLLTNNPVRQSMSKVTSIVTVILPCGANFMWLLLHLYDVILNARHVLTDYDLMASRER